MVHISNLSCVDGPSSIGLAMGADIRDAVEVRELNREPEAFAEAVEGRIDLAAVRPGIASLDLPWTLDLGCASDLLARH